MWRMKRCNNLMLVTYKSFFKDYCMCIIMAPLLLAFFSPRCQHTILGQLCPWLMWKLHFLLFFLKKCYFDTQKKGVSLNAINETILSCLCMSVLSPTLCYDMHREFHSWSESFNLHLHLEKNVNVGERRHCSASCICCPICVYPPPPFCFYEVNAP